MEQKDPHITDPLRLLPSEIVLRILDFTSISTIASLTRATKNWHYFIEKSHQDHIYSDVEKTLHPPEVKDFSSLSGSESFCRYYHHVKSWRDLCKRQTLLARNWASAQPLTRESTIKIGDDPVWRFKPDFKRRFFLSSSHAGGLNVTDMDTGKSLFHLPRESVRPFAHLEYQDGTLVFDREGDAVEVWRTEVEGDWRGVFYRVAVLPHDKQTRGFQLSFNTLCVASSEGTGYVWSNMLDTPTFDKEFPIETGAIGHLDQDENAIVYSIGVKGYHFYEKATGDFLGHFHPEFCDRLYHVRHPEGNSCRLDLPGTTHCFPPERPATDRTTPLQIQAGPYPRESSDQSLEDDEWGACQLSGKMMVGISRGGRVFVCRDWRQAVKSQAAFEASSYIIECVTADTTFDLGGWLSVRNHRIMFEIQDKVYVLGLTDENLVATTATGSGATKNPRPSIAFGTSLESRLAVPISFMGLYEDCIMSTYTTICARPRPQTAPEAGPWRRVMPTKVIRVLSFAPSEDEVREGRSTEKEVEDMSAAGMSFTRSDIHRLITMIAGDPDDEESGGDDG